MFQFKRKVSTFFDKENKSYDQPEFEYSQERFISTKNDYTSDTNQWLTIEQSPNKHIMLEYERSNPSLITQDHTQRGDIEIRPYSMHRLMDEDQWSCEGVYHTEKSGIIREPWYTKLRTTLTPTKSLRLTTRPPVYEEMKDTTLEESTIRKTKFQSIKGFGKFARKRSVVKSIRV
ncbi:hypothetical protein K7432_007369 [Basidiobolus ranarum]|uniref:Uncharacterized protein n=1 Tax=Basidiobolus ranarum TaxID=34480 RepID=A0ABR2WTJ5_9FUNG